MERRAPCRESLHGEKVFAEKTFPRRRVPWRAPLHGEVLRGENLSEQKESCQPLHRKVRSSRCTEQGGRFVGESSTMLKYEPS
jgi:hypothetical protein